MKSSEMITRILTTDKDIINKIHNEIPIAILQVAEEVASKYLDLPLELKSDPRYNAIELFLAGYITAKNEQQIILDDIFFNGDKTNETRSDK